MDNKCRAVAFEACNVSSCSQKAVQLVSMSCGSDICQNLGRCRPPVVRCRCQMSIAVLQAGTIGRLAYCAMLLKLMAERPLQRLIQHQQELERLAEQVPHPLTFLAMSAALHVNDCPACWAPLFSTAVHLQGTVHYQSARFCVMQSTQ